MSSANGEITLVDGVLTSLPRADCPQQAFDCLTVSSSKRHSGKVLDGFISSGSCPHGKRFNEFYEALKVCLEHPLAGGVVRHGREVMPGTHSAYATYFTVSSGSTLKACPRGQEGSYTSYVKAELIDAAEALDQQRAQDYSAHGTPSHLSEIVGHENFSLPHALLARDAMARAAAAAAKAAEDDKSTEDLLRKIIMEKIAKNENEMYLLEESISEEKAIVAEKEKIIYGTNAEIAVKLGEVESLKKQLEILGNVDKIGVKLSTYRKPSTRFNEVTDKWITIYGADSMTGKNAGPEPCISGSDGWHEGAGVGSHKLSSVLMSAGFNPEIITLEEAHEHCTHNNLRGFTSVVYGGNRIPSSIYWRDASQTELVANLRHESLGSYASDFHIAPGAPIDLLKQKEEEGFLVEW